MACACKGRSVQKYEWTSEPNSEGTVEKIVYSTEIQAKAKVLRMGGSYVPLAPVSG